MLRQLSLPQPGGPHCVVHNFEVVSVIGACVVVLWQQMVCDERMMKGGTACALWFALRAASGWWLSSPRFAQRLQVVYTNNVTVVRPRNMSCKTAYRSPVSNIISIHHPE